MGLVADYGTFSTDGYRDNSAAERRQFNGKLSFGPGADTRVHVATTTVELPPVTEGHVLVRNHYMSVDPYMRGRMSDELDAAFASPGAKARHVRRLFATIADRFGSASTSPSPAWR